MNPFAIELGGDAGLFQALRVEGVERLGNPWDFNVLAVPGAHTVDLSLADLDALVGADIKVSWSDDEQEDLVHQRLGFVQSVGGSLGGYEIGVRPKLAMLAHATDYRVFVDKSSVVVAEQVLGEWGHSVRHYLDLPPAPRPQTVQYHEATLGFLQRILADDGVTLDAGDGECALLLSGADSFPKERRRLVVTDAGEAELGGTGYAAVWGARLRRRAGFARQTSKHWDPLQPGARLYVEAGSPGAPREHYTFGVPFFDEASGKRATALLREADVAETVVLEAHTTSRGVRPGRVIELESMEPAFEGRWLVIEASWHFQIAAVDTGRRSVEVAFKAVPAQTGFRPSRSPIPGVGLTSVDVVGAGGSEIDPDPHGRVVLRHRWDRRNARDHSASARQRVVQPALSGGIAIPRVGWEELAFASGRSHDALVAVGRLVNGSAPPPQRLPGASTGTALGTRSTPGGGPGNRIAFDDAKGKEGFHVNAGKDLVEKATNDKTTSVKASESLTIGGSQTISTGQVFGVAISGGQTVTVGGSRNLSVAANVVISAGSESVSVGGARIFSVGGDQHIESKGPITRMVGGAKGIVAIESESRSVAGAAFVGIGGSLLQRGGSSVSLEVAGAHAESIGGPRAIRTTSYALTVRGVLQEQYGARTLKGSEIIETAKGAMSITSGATTLKGADVVIEADSKITIQASGATITIVAGSVTIDAKYVNSGGAVNSSSESYD